MPRFNAEAIGACEAHLAEVSCSGQLYELTGPCASLWTGRVALGGACGVGIESFVCDAASTCVVGLDFCGQCEAKVAVGESCNAEARCASAAVWRALPWGSRVRRRSPVSLAQPCELGRCEGFVFVQAGEACDARRRCAYGADCVSERCELVGALGRPSAEGGCVGGVCGADGLCESFRLEGEVCEQPERCLSGRCEAGRCGSGLSECLAE